MSVTDIAFTFIREKQERVLSNVDDLVKRSCLQKELSPMSVN